MNNSRLKILVTTITRNAIPGLLFVLLFAACNNDTAEINALMGKTMLQEDKAEDVTIIRSENGIVKAKIFAKEFIRNEVAKPPFIDMKKGIRAEFFNDSARVTTTVTARYARYYEKEGNILIRDSIVIISNKGERLATEELIYNDKLKKFYTEKFVRIHTASQVIYGNGLEANQDFTWYKITNIKGIIQVEKNEVPVN